jgi:hypothetical protein
MQYAASVAPAQPVHPRSLVRICILNRLLGRYHDTFRAFFIADSVAPDQTA